MRSTRSRPTPSPSVEFDAIGTRWQIDADEPLSPGLVSAVIGRTDDFDRVWSRFRDDSLVHEIASGGGSFELPAEANTLFDLYRMLYECTDGAVSPLVGEALERAGYDRTYSLEPRGAASAVPRWEDAVAWDGRVLDTVKAVTLDVGAAGKGYLVDLVAEVLVEAGVTTFTIDASGDILHRSPRPLRVALEHPGDPTKAIGVATVRDGALCASATNRRAWRGTHHVIDALTGLPVRDVVATWAMAPTALVADGLATALFFGDASRLTERFDFEFVRMWADGRIETSAGFTGETFR